MNAEPPDLALKTLRKRWEDDPAPQLSLQLAEEYGRRGEPAEAIKVLETGVERYPRHLSTRVALGRYLFEDGQAVKARERLEEVTADDPSHLVANKLLVHAHLALGEDKKARERLDLYSLLNDGDPEIEILEERLSSTGSLGTPVQDEPSGVESPAAAPAALESTGDAGGALLANLLTTTDVEAVSEPEPELGTEQQSEEDAPTGELGGLGGGDKTRHLSEAEAGSPPLQSEDRPSPRGDPPADLPAEPVVDGTSLSSSAVASGQPDSDPFGNVWELAATKGFRENTSEDDLFALGAAALSAIASVDQHESDASLDESVGLISPAGEPAVPESIVEPLDSEDSPEDTSPSLDEAQEATITLGRLYLEQGHRLEAEKVFAQILDREPESRAARIGLRSAQSDSRWAVSAFELLPAEVLDSVGTEGWKRTMLNGYLARLKQDATA